VAETSKLMLEGWKMMETLCPVSPCNNPLLAKGAEIFCPGCGQAFVTEANAVEQGYTSNNPAGASPESRRGIGQVTDSDEAQAWAAKRDAASKLMGEKMLAGWTMLAECCSLPHCHGIPLMRERKSGDVYCVCCERTIVAGGDDGGGEGTDGSKGAGEEEQKEAAAAASLGRHGAGGRTVPLSSGACCGATDARAPSGPDWQTGLAAEANADVYEDDAAADDAAFTEALNGASGSGGRSEPGEDMALVRERRNKATAAMGTKMLQGWAMLNETCEAPDCLYGGFPMLQKRGGEKLCLYCDMFSTPTPKAPPAKAKATTTTTTATTTATAIVPPTTTIRTAVPSPATTPAPAPIPAPVPAPIPAPAPKKTSRIDDASACMTPKLLAGWTMLSATCASCGVPLMHPKGKTKNEAECVYTDCPDCPDCPSKSEATATATATATPPAAKPAAALSAPIGTATAPASTEDENLEDWEEIPAGDDPADADFVKAYNARRYQELRLSQRSSTQPPPAIPTSPPTPATPPTPPTPATPPPTPRQPSPAKLALQAAASEALSTLTFKITRVNEALKLSNDPEGDVVLAEQLSKLCDVAFKIAESPGM